MLTPEGWQRRKAIFEAALDAPRQQRDAVIERMCSGDMSLASDVRRLLEGAEAENEFLDAGVAPGRELVAGQVLCGRFQLLRLAGEGGMGQVWAAMDQRLGEHVAIKTLQLGLASDAAGLERFQRELQLARRIGHPNVCRVFELFEESAISPPRVFLTMELLDGETLAARLKREGRLTPHEALRFFEQMAGGLEAAHGVGVVHRDLKPSNIMLVPDGPGREDRVVIMDFGLARSHRVGIDGSGSTTAAGSMLGTPDYMAPEQIRGERATPSTDIYSLGLILFEMLQGAVPFHSRNTMDSWMRRIREGPPKLARSGMLPNLDPRVDEVIAGCLEYEPEKRYRSALETAVALRRPRWNVQWLRHPTAAGAVLVLALGLLAYRGLNWGSGANASSAEALKLYDDALRDLSEGAAARAGNALRRAIAGSPGFAAAHAALAEAHLELDQSLAAREAIQRATDLAPDRSRLPVAQALHIEGVNRLILRDCPGATDSLRKRVAVVDAAVRPEMVVSLARAYERCEMTSEAAEALRNAAQLDPRNAAVRLRAAYLASRRKEPVEAERLLGEAEMQFRERGNFEGVGEVLILRGTLASEAERLDAASQTLMEALNVARTTASVQQQVKAMLQQAIVFRKRGDLSEADRVTQEAVALARRQDLESLAMEGLMRAANVDFSKNQLAAAKRGFEQVLDIATRYRDEANQAWALLSLGSLNLRQGHSKEAEQFIARAKPFYVRTANRIVLNQVEALEVSMLMARAELAGVLAIRLRRLDEARKTGDETAVTSARRNLIATYMEMGRWSDAFGAIVELGNPDGKDPQGMYDLLEAEECAAALGKSQVAMRERSKARAIRNVTPSQSIRRDYSEAVSTLYLGTNAEAARRLAIFLKRRDVDGTIRVHATLMQCAALAEGNDDRAAEQLCRDVIRDTENDGRLLIPALARMWLAEAKLRAGDRATALDLARQSETILRPFGPGSEWLWRSQAVKAIAEAQPLPAFPFEAEWRRRPDIDAFFRLSKR